MLLNAGMQSNSLKYKVSFKEVVIQQNLPESTDDNPALADLPGMTLLNVYISSNDDILTMDKAVLC